MNQRIALLTSSSRYNIDRKSQYVVVERMYDNYLARYWNSTLTSDFCMKTLKFEKFNICNLNRRNFVFRDKSLEKHFSGAANEGSFKKTRKGRAAGKEKLKKNEKNEGKMNEK